MTDVSALILAGGRATRMGGVAKHELVVEGETIFARQVRVLAPRVAEVIVAGREIEGYRCVNDAIEGAGPLAGIAAGLAAARTAWLVVLAGDMPYVTGDVFDRLFAARGEAIDAVCVRDHGRPEPLVSVLHARTRAVVEGRLAAGRFKTSGLFTDEDLRVAWLDDIDPRALRSVNQPNDLRE